MTLVHPLVDPSLLRARLGPDAARALDEMLATLAEDPPAIGRLFAGAARRTARGDLEGAEGGHRVEDAVRVELVRAAAAGLDPGALAAELEALYRHGDADERRAVLLALAATGDADVDGSELLLDALRTNDVRLVAAAMGPHADRLTPHDWRHGVLKCLFVGVPLHAVAHLDERTDADLAAMVRRYAAEREAAGRPVPPDAARFLGPTALTTPSADLEG
ncbi:EboA domain-containing protein [Nocardioides sp. zg-DK7169]|uniref:EboA domain-containing protein n=1 Tax=Nocardioides sp. zg-DK7169 TaxID=2736600 RepID=UPI001556C89B|nr:EboA domain-containing protein [Nocardioides sp. zg-DK7169]NPC96201.1 EboA domain-containing protein [Nocardioides sp. zg-DK7169]